MFSIELDNSHTNKNYSKISYLRDGPKLANGNRRIQLTLGIGFTEYTNELQRVLVYYLTNSTNTSNKNALIKLLEKQGVKTYSEKHMCFSLSNLGSIHKTTKQSICPLITNKDGDLDSGLLQSFQSLFVILATEQVWKDIMDRVYKLHEEEAEKWCHDNFVFSELGHLIMTDSFIQGLGSGKVLKEYTKQDLENLNDIGNKLLLTNDISNLEPKRLQYEKTFLTNYCKYRYVDLGNINEETKKTTWRPIMYLREIEYNNFDLTQNVVIKIEDVSYTLVIRKPDILEKNSALVDITVKKAVFVRASALEQIENTPKKNK